MIDQQGQKVHTPSPWVWLDRGDHHDLVHFLPGETFANGEPAYVRVHSDGSAGGEYGPDVDVNGPDGRLLAAAPDLLAACEDMLHDLRQRAMPSPSCVHKVQDAVAKAKGG